MVLEKINPESFAVKYDIPSQQIYQTALQNFSLVKAVDLRKQSAEKGVLVAKGGLFPTLSFNGSASTNYSTVASRDIFINTTDFTSTDYVTVNNTQYPLVYKVDNYNTEKINYGSQLSNNLFTSFSLNLRIPIFNSLQQRNRIKLAKISLKNNELVASTTKTELQQSIEQAYINMGSAADRYKTLLEQVAAFTESFRAADIRFNSGVGNSIDYLTAKNNLDRAALNLVMAKYDFVLRTKVLDYYQGLPLW
jgi:outer membrane protein